MTKAIVDTKHRRIIAMAEDFGHCYAQAITWLSIADPETLPALSAERSELNVLTPHAAESLGRRFYCAQATKELYLKVYNLAEKDRSFYLNPKTQQLSCEAGGEA